MSRMKQAFSLIELSIVILIIGILIAGAVGGSRLVNAFKVTTAQTITNSSPIGQTSGLISWYETSLESSFDVSESVDSNTLTNWYDNNTQSTIKYNATQSTLGNRPSYSIDNTLGFPVVSFGASKYFNLPNSTIPTGNNPYSFVIVSKIASDCSCGILTAGTAATDNINAVSYVSGNKLNNYWWGDDVATTSAVMSPAGVFHIIVVTYDSRPGRKIYVDGVQATLTGTASSTAKNTTSTNHAIGYSGGVNYYLTNGKIGELAIFSRSLKSDERKDIEKYLSKKFKIYVTP